MPRPQDRTARKHRRSTSGQASIMFGMMMVTFALFFAFVVNVGMLVHAKINLQNAADAAAYAGAATQARQLNHIGYLNYEMRRQYKKFLFRYYVLGNLARKDADGTSGPRTYPPNNKPAVCVIFNARDNICQNDALVGIQIPQANVLDSLQNTLVEQLKQLETARQANCSASALTNQMVLSLWLFNTDPSLDTIASQLASTDPAIQNAVTVTQSLGRGLGIYPKEMILKERIKTLASYVNSTPQTGVTVDQIQGLRESADPAFRERTILAFESAFRSLGDHTFDNIDSIVMDELLPTSTDGADLLSLIPVTTTFDAYFSTFYLENTGNQNSANCKQILAPITVSVPLPLGFVKNTGKLVYYAVRLSADAKLLFNPFGSSLKLKAYASAQPFGSRIGPLNVTGDDYSEDSGASALADACGLPGSDCVKKLPNMTMMAGKNWNDLEVESPYRQVLRQSATDSIDSAALEKTYQVAMAPNALESGRYLMVEDQHAADPFIQHFDEGNGASDPTYAFWAPIRSPEKAAGEKPEDLINEMFGSIATGQSSSAASGATAGNDATDKLAGALRTGLTTYFAKLREGKGEDGDGFNVTRLKNPFRTLASAGYTPISLGEELGLNEVLQVKTGWAHTRYSSTWETGRSGYSVKFVPLKMLQLAEPGGGTMPSTDGAGATWNNFPNLIDADAESDFDKIQH